MGSLFSSGTNSTDQQQPSAVQKPEINLLVGANAGKKPIETCRATHCRETRYLIGYPLRMSGRYKTKVTGHSKFKFKSDLNDQQIKEIRSSWVKVLPDKTQHGKRLFYKVFEMAPYLMDLFPFGSDLTQPQFTEHALRVMNTVDLAVKNLDNPDVLVPALEKLGRAHAMFELTNQEFEYVGQALLSVLEEGLGEAFTPALKAAWTDAYAIITDIMVTAITDYNTDKKDNKTNN